MSTKKIISVDQVVLNAKIKCENGQDLTREELILVVGNSPEDIPDWFIDYCFNQTKQLDTSKQIGDPADRLLDAIVFEFFDAFFEFEKQKKDSLSSNLENDLPYKPISFGKAYKTAKTTTGIEQELRTVELRWQKEIEEDVSFPVEESVFAEIGLPQTPRTKRINRELIYDEYGIWPRTRPNKVPSKWTRSLVRKLRTKRPRNTS